MFTTVDNISFFPPRKPMKIAPPPGLKQYYTYGHGNIHAEKSIH